MPRQHPPRQPDIIPNPEKSPDELPVQQEAKIVESDQNSERDALVEDTTECLGILAEKIDTKTFKAAIEKLNGVSPNSLERPNVDVAQAYLLLTTLLFFVIDRDKNRKDSDQDQEELTRLQAEKLQLDIDKIKNEPENNHQQPPDRATDSIDAPEFFTADVHLYTSLLKRAALTLANEERPEGKQLSKLPKSYLELKLDKHGDLVLIISEEAKTQLRGSAFDRIDPRFGYELVQHGSGLAYRGKIDKDDIESRRRFQTVLSILRGATVEH